MEFADAHGARTAAQWNTYLHAVIDNKTFQVYKNGKTRDFAAQPTDSWGVPHSQPREH